ncbi:MAG: septum formation protein Maf [Bacteroidetes bacterium]|nr:septum formation protein Maf [Bacteroidota bacterium]
MKEYPYKVILGSKSPRRQQLLKELGFQFETLNLDIDESFEKRTIREEIPIHLAEKKSDAFGEVPENTVLLTSDTIVWVNGEAMNKPEGREQAIAMLENLSGRMHEVITAVCLRTSSGKKTFHVVTDVHFKKLKRDEIEYYVDTFEPYDKAGAYGIQEWIGYIGIEKINGSFYNVMGLPLMELYQQLWALAKKGQPDVEYSN